VVKDESEQKLQFLDLGVLIRANVFMLIRP